MTAEPHPQRCLPQENGNRVYCIFEKQLYCLMRGWTHTSFSDPKNIISTIIEDNPLCASHSSAKSERGKCPQNKIWDHCPVSERILQDEREKVLDEYLEWLQAMADIANDDANRQENYVEKVDCAGKCAGFLQAKEKLEKLRSKQGEQR